MRGKVGQASHIFRCGCGGVMHARTRTKKMKNSLSRIVIKKEYQERIRYERIHISVTLDAIGPIWFICLRNSPPCLHPKFMLPEE